MVLTLVQLSLEAVIIPLTREVVNDSVTIETKLRPFAPLVTPLKLVESVAVDQHADHIAPQLQARQATERKQ